MKRSNRLVLLVGVFLAIVAFVGIILVLGSPKQDESTKPKTEQVVVVAIADIPLSTKIGPTQVGTKTVPIDGVLPGAFTDPSQVIGKVARETVKTGAQITSATLTGGAAGQIREIDCPATYRCVAVQVDQITGVGTIIKTGDYVDMVVGFTADKFPVITVSPADGSITVVAGLNPSSVKILLQGMQVMGTLLPPPTAGTTGTDQASPAPDSGPTTALNDQKEIVILAVTAQQAEVVKFAELDGKASLMLRSPDDFIDPLTGSPLPPEQAATTGIILKTLVDSYGVLPPEVIQTVTPKK